MNRRQLIINSMGLAATLAVPLLHDSAAAAPLATPSADDLPELDVILTDNGFAIAQPLLAGRYRVVVSNIGASANSHSALGKIPDQITDEQYQAWLDSEDGETDALKFEDIAFVGMPDWPPPGGHVSGIIDLTPGRYFLFDPFSARGYRTLHVGGKTSPSAEPTADCTVTLHEMAIDLPDAAMTSKPVRWKIENTGGMCHEVAIIPRSSDFTEADLKNLLALPEDATPPPGTPEFVYQPVAAIGILAPRHTSWLNVQLKPGAYIAVCMLPFTTGYPHAMDGMYRFFEVK
jgi:hypothetical protein